MMRTLNGTPDVDDDPNLNEIFFDHFFPSVKGHAKMVDKYLALTSSPMHKTVRDDKFSMMITMTTQTGW
jgi:hypothetical protein